MMIGSSIDDGYNIESTRREAYQAGQGKQCLPSIDRRFSYKSAGIQMSSRKDLKVRPTTFLPIITCEVSFTLQDPKRGLTVNFKNLIFTFSKEKTYKYMLYYGTTKKEELFNEIPLQFYN